MGASEIARLAYCERQIQLDATRGRRTTAQQRAARHRGLRAHGAFYAESQRLAERSVRRGKCFVATLALGDSTETGTLRAFRDLCLRRSACGRRVIASYYRLSPAVCDFLAGRPWVLSLVRQSLRLVARVAGLFVRRRMARGGLGDGT